MLFRSIIWLCLLIHLNDVNCLTSSSETQPTITWSTEAQLSATRSAEAQRTITSSAEAQPTITSSAEDQPITTAPSREAQLTVASSAKAQTTTTSSAEGRPTTASSTEPQPTITVDECLRMMHENSSVVQREMKPKSKCESTGCVKIAAQILDYIDENVDICDNFYQFANGRYINETTSQTEDEEVSQGFYSTVTDLVNKKVGPLLSEPIQPDEWKPFELVKNFYQSCLNQEVIVRRGNQELIDILDALEGFPAVKDTSWPSSKFDLSRLIKKVKELGFDTDIIFGAGVYVDSKNTTNKVLHIGSGSYEMNEDIGLAKYRQKMFQKSAIFADKKDEKAKERIRKDMEKVWTFEKTLTEISSDDDAYGDDYVEPVVSIKQLQESYPYLNWLDYINALLPSGLNVTENEPVVNVDTEFFEKLAAVMNVTSNRTIANYIVWRAIYSLYKLQTFETGTVRRGKCINLTSKLFSIPVGLLYSRKYFSENSRQAVISLVEDVRNAFIDILAGVTWMDEETRQKAIAKAEKIIAHVGYPNELYEGNGLEQYYEGLEMDPEDLFNNWLQWNSFNNDKQWNGLRQPTNRSGWEELLTLDPTEANAFYDSTRNAMQFPIAILHELFFSEGRPQYINYATLGNTIGHEITHGFDNDGRKYDLNGNLINWWNLEAKREFTRRAECFIDQYSQFTDTKTNLQVDGERTLNENMADNGGTRAAYYAYLNWIKRNGAERLVPGVKYNQKQLFWISYAQAESSVDSEYWLTYIIENDEHAPGEIRINGVVSNLQEFADDFNCPVGTKMNPMKKCRVW